MTGSISHLKLPPDARPREHYDLALAQVSEWLADAEMLGGWRALQDHTDEATRVAYLAKSMEHRAQRAHYWEARIRGELEARR